MKTVAFFPALAAAAALVSAQAQAATQPTCLTEREVANLAIYAAPALVQGVRGKCAASLSSSGFLATKGDAFAARYAALQNETWPVAKEAAMKLAGAKAGTKDANDLMATLSGLPDNAVRPLLDGLISQKIGEAIHPGDCANVERGIQLASVIGPRDSGALIGFVLAMVKPKDPPICPAHP